MGIDNIFSIGQFGLTYERLRLEAATHNIAVANVPVSGTEGPHAIRVHAGQGDFASLLESLRQTETTGAASFRVVNDPDHPLADDKGNVRFPDVNVVDEMTTLVSAGRGYEANVRAINSLREMLLKSLEIGK